MITSPHSVPDQERTHESFNLDILTKLPDLRDGLIKGISVDVAHQDIGAILSEEDTGFETNSAGSSGDDAVLPRETSHYGDV